MEKNKGGRPKITLDKLPKGWKENMLALAAEGGSELECRVSCLDNISHETWERLIKEEPEFSETVKRCRALCEQWWLRLGREGSAGKQDIQPTTWIFNMKNRFGWTDRTDHTTAGDKMTLVVDERATDL